jgi:hypothetical protein
MVGSRAAQKGSGQTARMVESRVGKPAPEPVRDEARHRGLWRATAAACGWRCGRHVRNRRGRESAQADFVAAGP